MIAAVAIVPVNPGKVGAVYSESEGGRKTWAVALVPAAGYPLDLRYFSDATASFQADEFATELGHTTGLEVRHEAA